MGISTELLTFMSRGVLRLVLQWIKKKNHFCLLCCKHTWFSDISMQHNIFFFNIPQPNGNKRTKNGCFGFVPWQFFIFRELITFAPRHRSTWYLRHFLHNFFNFQNVKGKWCYFSGTKDFGSGLSVPQFFQ